MILHYITSYKMTLQYIDTCIYNYIYIIIYNYIIIN